MHVIEQATNENKPVVIQKITDDDFKKITARRYFFNWRKLSAFSDIYKLTQINDDDILGLIALVCFNAEQRIEIKLLAAVKENIGSDKLFDRITGCLIAFACKEALEKYENPCVSLIPKTALKMHYIKRYGMYDAGTQIYLEDMSLLTMIRDYL